MSLESIARATVLNNALQNSLPPELIDIIKQKANDQDEYKIKVEANTLTKVAGAVYYYFFKWITLGSAWFLKAPIVAIQNWRYKAALRSGKDEAMEVAKSALRWGADAHLDENDLIALSKNNKVKQLTFHVAQQSSIKNLEWSVGYITHRQYGFNYVWTLPNLQRGVPGWDNTVWCCSDSTAQELQHALLTKHTKEEQGLL